LAQQLWALRRLATVVPLDEALRDLAGGRPLPPRAVAITFDDGYRDTLTLAGPLLRALDLPATVFLVPGILSGEVTPWWERIAWAFARCSVKEIEWEGRRLALRRPALRRSVCDHVAQELKGRDRAQREQAVDALVELLAPEGSYHPEEMFLDWDGARALVREGFAIGSHSMRHAILSRESAQAQREDLSESRRVLQDELGVAVSLFCYPNGTQSDYDAVTIAGLAGAGYTHAVTTRAGWNRRSTPVYELRRTMMQPERGAPGLAVVARDLARSLASQAPADGAPRMSAA
jgi:peptidoglycan/xylan/chitin deacetylase (PgdA/CDA1 family)